MSLQKYLQTISHSGKIYVENVRAALHVSTLKARTYCEMAVADNLFVRKVGVVCPNDKRIIAEFNNENDIPDEITCNVCRADGIEPDTFKTKDLQKIIFYKVNRHDKYESPSDKRRS